MSKLAEQRYCQDDHIRRVKLMFADMLFGQLWQSAYGDKAIGVLAAHLNVDTEDVQKWLKAEALPCFELFDRLLFIIKGVDYEVDRTSGFHHIYELIRDIERAKILCNIELTQPKSR